MELNRAQLLVHDDDALNKFRSDHYIPKDPNAKGGDGALPPHLHMELLFSAEDLLHVYTLVQSKREPGTPFLKEFNDQFKSRSKECKEVIQAINNRQASRKMFLPGTISILSSDNEHSDDLAYAPLQLAGEVKIAYSFSEGKQYRCELSLQRATAISKRMKEQSTEIKKSKNKISSLEKQAKLALEAAEKARLELAVTVELGQEGTIAIKDDIIATEDGAATKEASPNLSLDM
ncbi:hypothetical protein Acr_25g0000700 [Actinidia rufa]|uniref:Uncharacterized protein n=1 Tax=Actinidia rufa TaxID=165716 RepID=A0A7J0GY17_9ERIC|nr:hypothetical protein Acr_25g0000700 [Actinidia rufa]